MTGAASTTTYAYNGDGDRVSQTVDGTLTTYTLDTATPLTRLLAETTGPDTTFTLHGLGLVTQSDGSTTEYFSADGLGSVRQLTDSTGSVLLNQTFDPYGNPYGSTGPGDTRFGFTGEQVDGNGLVYLRARYYQPRMGRFLNADPSRQERNPYQYAYSNPVKFTDPSGQTVDCSWFDSCINVDNARDLTSWLYREMVHSAKDPILQMIKDINKIAGGWAGVGIIACGVGLIPEPAEPLIIVAGGIALAGAGGLHAEALYMYAEQVKNGARYDFKDEIGNKLGPGITLCSSGGCVDDIEYSVPGNIFFAYIGRETGFHWWEIKLGAAWAEAHDPAHDLSSPEYVGPYNGERDLSSSDPVEWNFGDEPQDNVAVTLGIKLWDKFGASMTLSQFKSELGSYISGLQRHSPDKTPVPDHFARYWPYPVGYFNNVGKVYNPPIP